MAKYVSGFCSIGLHEGLAPKNINGKKLCTCTMIETCNCTCHEMYDKMYEMSGLDRIPVDNSGYIADKGDFVMPTLTDRVDEQLSKQPVTVIESDTPELVPNAVVRTFNQTPTGRAARGELEQQVNQVCLVWAVEQEPTLCTPSYISEEIAKTQGIKAPSVGAIGAVFDRWSAMGYAVTAKKPVRFVGFTDEGRSLGLDGCKAKARQAKSRAR